MRIVLIVLDSVGVGDAPDASAFGTDGSSTVGNVAKWSGGLELPTMARLGFGELYPFLGVSSPESVTGCYGVLCETSNAVDSTTGHWEMMGLEVEEPFPTYPEGFPSEVIEPFEEAIGREVLGNRPASGTVIIEELGSEHLETGKPIVYTSADSVFQIAAHEDVVPVEQLYDICETAREILTGDHAVGRVIARPFVGELGSFERTHHRKDYTLEPGGKTVLDDLADNGHNVYSVGKISQIFSGQGISESHKIKNNHDAVDRIMSLLSDAEPGSLIFANLVDFDQRYGHRNDPAGYANALEDWDNRLDSILGKLTGDDFLMVTADHGTDPTTETTDHSRELVPLLVAGPRTREDVDLGVRISFQDLGQTILDAFGLPKRLDASSFMDDIF